VLRAADIELKDVFKDGDALITRARASLVAQFLDDPTATHLLFIDADIGFEPAQVLRLLDCGADLCAAIYPIKRIDWDKVRTAVLAARPSPGAAALNYVFEVADPAAVVMRAGFVKVRYAATGFMMIRRDALSRMRAHYPQLRYRRDHSTEAGHAERQPVRPVRLHDRRERHLSQRGFQLLPAMGRHGRRDLGRSQQHPQSRRPGGVPRRLVVAIRVCRSGSRWRCRRRRGRCGINTRRIRRLLPTTPPSSPKAMS
jgi:hypothetical protein